MSDEPRVQSWIEVRVAGKRSEAADIVSFELVDPAGRDLPPFSAGAHIDVAIGEGLVRQYSLCNDGSERDRYQIAVLKEPASRGGSRFLHESLAQGDAIRISAPRNHFPLHPEARRSLLFAGGIGVTPMLCMAERLANVGADFELYYCARSLDRAAFAERLQASFFADRVHLHLDDGAAAQKLDLPAVLGSHSAGLHVYVCGPGGFIDWVLTTAQAAGFPPESLHREYFSTDAATNRDAPDRAFQIQVASTGEILDVPADRSVAEVLAGAGVDVPVSCEQGVCGSCLTRVLEGDPDHRDFYQTDDEKKQNDHFTPCVSRSRSALLVLDL